jgi:8-oxo-dGTP pyrophosphatase MutT (NUDIX family)
MISQLDKAFRLPAVLVSVVCLLISAETAVFAGEPAGILLYHRDGDKVFVLLANDSKGTRGWSGFGGGADNGESLRDTAARETEEETRGYFSRTWLAEQIAYQEPHSSRGFHMYFVEVPFVPAQRVMNSPVEGHQAAMKETQFYAWVPFSELERALANDNPSAEDLKMNALYIPRGCKAHSFWRVWILNMRDAHKQGVFPWNQDKTGTEQNGAPDADKLRQ